MSKTVPFKNNSTSSDNSEKSYEVQKIINQRVINNKKQYKVIWVGYTFEEATWEPEENLKCPEKINEFLKRYQDVIKRKNLMNKNASQSLPPVSPNSQRSSISLQRPQNSPSPQPKILQNPGAVLNKDKLKASLQKNSLISQKKSPDIQNLKSKIMTQPNNQGLKVIPNEQQRPSVQLNADSNSNGPFASKQAQVQNRQNFSGTEAYNRPSSPTNMNNGSKISISVSPPPVQKTTASHAVKPSAGLKVIKIQNSPFSNTISKTQTPVSFSSSNKKNESKIQPDQQFVTLQDEQIPRRGPTKSGKQVQNQNLSSQRQSLTSSDREIQIKRQGYGRQQNFRFLGKDQLNGQIINEERKISSVHGDNTEEHQMQDKDSKPQQKMIKMNERLDIEQILAISHLSLRVDSESESEKVAVPSRQSRTPVYFIVKNRFNQTQQIVERERIINQQPLKLIEFYQNALMQAYDC